MPKSAAPNPTAPPTAAPASAPAPVGGRPDRCPECSAPVDPDPRFTAWCPACEWNLVPAEEAAEDAVRSAKELAREGAAAERTERLFEDVVAGRADTTRRDWLAASALAVPVHLVTVAVTGSGLWLLATGNTPLRCLGALLLAVAFLLRPRLGRVPSGQGVLTRAEAPALYGLTDRIAAELGAPPIGVIQVDDSFNASMAVVGPRRTSVLTLGLPLWEALDGPQRIAVLGHELAHRVNGDHRRGLWLGSAMRSLAHWYDLSLPRERTAPGYGVVALLTMIGDYLGNAFLRLLSGLLFRAYLVLDRLTARAGQQAEYHADELGARVGSTGAARESLAAVLLHAAAGTVTMRLRAEIQSRPRSGRRDAAPGPDTDALWPQLRAHLAAIPPLERERLLRRSRRSGHAVDASHPPTHLRIAALARRTPVPAAVVCPPEEAAAVDSELAPHRTRVARTLLAG
ncbi:M48 family metalloprotease [Kitasatospora purpeofusca]|uniref:M48 family metalloprotease n=1 Tax=Kitasatospora purpeofusca TaxID=67352 RepID=UPI002A599137|nr:M48 family metalloprotease [Kitasatospora purpeofusca]MDY0815020.1 M48 family metalloprotease [Kitasatospora purpeofusca]